MSADLVDLDVSWRSPPAPDDERAAAVVDAAVAGGVSTVVVSVVDADGIGVGDVADARAAFAALAVAANTAGVAVVPAFCPVNRDGGLADLHVLAEVRAHLDSDVGAEQRPVWRLRKPTDDALLLRRLGDLARAHDAVVMVPAVDAGLADGAVAFEGAVATRFGFKAMPEAAEAIGVARVIEIARLTGGRFHLTGVATAIGAQMIESSGLDTVSGAVNAVHLLLDETSWARHPFDVRLLQRPPLPTSSSRVALIDVVKRGGLLVASGHRAVRKRDRDLEIGRASAGGTALASATRLLRDLLGAEPLSNAMSAGPRRLLGLADRAVQARSSGVVDDDLSRHVKEFAS